MRKTYHFTLVELLVAMGVFCLLLMVSMQIFGGAQKLWVSSEQKNEAFAAARIAMEFVASRIQGHAYSDDMPFEIACTAEGDYRIFFPTAMPMNRTDASGKNLDVYSMRFIGFEVVKKENDDDFGTLRMLIYSDEGDKNFLNIMPPYSAKRKRRGGNTYTSATAALDTVRKKIFPSTGSVDERNKIEIIENVTDFKLIAYNLPKTKNGDLVEDEEFADPMNTPPYLLEIEISVIDNKKNFIAWRDNKNMRKEIEREHGYTFRRAVLLGDRRRSF